MKTPEERPAPKLQRKDIVKIIDKKFIKLKQYKNNKAEVFGFLNYSGIACIDVDILPERYQTFIPLDKVVLYKRRGKVFRNTRII